MTSIVLGDDHAIFSESMVTVLLAEGFSVPAAAASLQETIAAVRRHRPDVCLASVARLAGMARRGR
jgi:two-component system nitrate/nitrite response regulator NarL